MKNYKLTKEEKKILEDVEKGVYKSVPNLEEEKKKYQAIAKYTRKLKKDKNINIRVSEITLQKLKMKAAEEGLPYQTLISSILYKYVNKGK